MNNWKMYGLWIGGVTIIPCYYDWLRYGRKLPIFAKKHLNIVRFTTIIYRFRKTFDTSLT